MNIDKQLNPSKIINKSDQIDLVFDISVLDLLCAFVLSDNKNIRRSHYIIVKNLIYKLNTNLYINDPEKIKRLNFIKKALDGRLTNNILNKNILFSFINGGIASESIGIDIQELNDTEIQWLLQTCSETLKCAFAYSYTDIFMDILVRFKNADYKDRYTIIKELEEICTLFKNDCRNAEVESLSDITFSLMPEKFENTINDILNIVTNPYRRLNCCMQGLNMMVGGGFEASRVYLLLGLTGSGKSLTLLNIAYQLKKANKKYICKDPTKRPCIVFFTMENDVIETVTRLYDIAIGKGEFKEHSIDTLIKILREDGQLSLNPDDPIDLIIKYKPNRSVDTGYLYTIVEDLEDDGYEVIAFFQDHIKRLRSIYKNSDIRLELGDIMNELKVFAQLKNIPVFTDSHLNRDAAKIIDTSPKNKGDITRLLGKSNVGESMLLLDNTDVAIIINKDYDEYENEYMVFASVKMRDKNNGLNYIAQPFKKGSSIALEEDLYDSIPVFKESLHDFGSNIKPNTNIKTSVYNNTFDDNEDNIFEKISKTSYESSNFIELKSPNILPPLPPSYSQVEQQKNIYPFENISQFIISEPIHFIERIPVHFI